jgi:hypothetical protein
MAVFIGVRAYCPSDWDNSGFSDIEDFTSFVQDFEAGEADFDCSGFTDTDDYDAPAVKPGIRARDCRVPCFCLL